MDEIRSLAARARDGDVQAAHSLREELEPQMLRIVRRAMRSGTASSPLARRILAVAAEVPAQSGAWPHDGEHVIGRVASRLCDSVISRLRPELAISHRMRETVRM
jgi:hypothetical protein